MKKYLFVFFLVSTYLLAQDTTVSEAFKHSKKEDYSPVRTKYVSYTLLTSYILVQEANKSDPFAQHELGLRYLLGKGFPADTVKAIYWIRKAVDQNLPFANYNYAILLYNGIGVPWNPFDAFYHFKKAADAGLPDAQFAMGIFYTDNLVVNRDYKKAYYYFKSSADAGYEQAKKAINELKRIGFVPTDSMGNDTKVAKNIDLTAPLIDVGWDLDFYNFQKDSATVNDSSIEILSTKDKNDLLKYLGINDSLNVINLSDTTITGIIDYTAKSGSPEALLLKARAIEKGRIYNKDLVMAAAYYLRSLRLGANKAAQYLIKMIQNKLFYNLLKSQVKQNNPDAMYVWAGLTALGLDYQLTNQQALEFLVKASKMNHIPSLLELGLCYYSGQLVKQDKKQAFYYWEMAADLGSIEASVRIAFANILQRTETNTEYRHEENSDLMKDLYTLQKAANQGSVLAQSALAYCYEKGIGFKENKAYAVKLYRLSAQRGSEAAYNSLKRMYDEIRPNDEIFKIYN
ncbi:tetratricopeptide repeat protein [Melioribacteraceae bacterium 4301-Me]|uniref:tetratricopeptide repeat protein n=1 Tax=Pyranulibacter aquaticus TaxID=3163344 RepID=UPI003598B2FF